MDSSLLHRLKDRDQAAWRETVELYGSEVFDWARRQGVPPEDAEDIMQQVFLVVLAKVEDFEIRTERGTFRAWLSKITEYKIMEFERKRRAARAESVGSCDEPPGMSFPEVSQSSGSVSSFDDGRLLRHALEIIRGEFTPRCCRAFEEVVIDRRTPEAVAERLGMSRNAVYLAKSRVLRRLREKLGDLPRDE